MFTGELSPALLSVIASNETFWLYSEGGCVYVMGAACDLLKQMERTVIAVGQCYSAAVPVLAAAEERCCTENCSFMVHAPSMSGSDWKGVGPAQKDTEELKRVTDLYFNVLGAKTRRSDQWWRKKCADGDFYFTAKEAKSWGLVDRVL